MPSLVPRRNWQLLPLQLSHLVDAEARFSRCELTKRETRDNYLDNEPGLVQKFVEAVSVLLHRRCRPQSAPRKKPSLWSVRFD